MDKVQDEEWHFFFLKHAHHDDATAHWFYSHGSLWDLNDLNDKKQLKTSHSDAVMQWQRIIINNEQSLWCMSKCYFKQLLLYRVNWKHTQKSSVINTQLCWILFEKYNFAILDS